MKLAEAYNFSKEQKEALKKAQILETITVLYMISVITLMYIVLGSSQAMKTAWIEDCLSLIPPLAFLIGSRICWRKPTKKFPYGFNRVNGILFLAAALALLVTGGYLLYESALKLIEQSHPTIGMREYFGHDMWLGWWMILVLLWGGIPPVILGRIKLKHAVKINDKVLYTGAMMNKADWLTALAAMIGVLGIGFGWWWADGLAALLISFDILKDGISQTWEAGTALLDRSPQNVQTGYSNLPSKIQNHLERKDWIERADIRLHEQGHLIFGEAFIKTSRDFNKQDAESLTSEVEEIDWRLQDITISYLLEPGKTKAS